MVRIGGLGEAAGEAAGEASADGTHTGAEARGKAAVGRRLSLYWPLDAAWYPATVHSYDKRSGKHRLLYEDGILEQVLNPA